MKFKPKTNQTGISFLIGNHSSVTVSTRTPLSLFNSFPLSGLMTRGSTVPGLLINQQGKDIGTGIMTAYIKIKTGLNNGNPQLLLFLHHSKAPFFFHAGLIITPQTGGKTSIWGVKLSIRKTSRIILPRYRFSAARTPHSAYLPMTNNHRYFIF